MPKTSKTKENSIETQIFAVIKTGGKQYKVAAGDVLKVEKLDSKSLLEFEDIYSGKKVSAKVIGEAKSKTDIIKFRAKKRYKRTRGHTQKYSLLEVQSIK